MRIIAGSFKGQNFDAPTGHRTHPMSEKIRGALFNILGDVSDLSILDVFGGSGAISLEAVSRGANNITVIDNDRSAQVTIRKNINRFGLEDKIKLISANAGSYLDQKIDIKYDLIIADPPYDKVNFAVLDKIPAHINKDGLLVLSWPGRERQHKLEGLKIIERKDYGDAQLIFYSLI